MSQFSKSSRQRLETCDYRLQEIDNTAIKNPPHDYGIAGGYRNGAAQQLKYDNGQSNAKPGESAHNRTDDQGEPDSGANDIFVYVDRMPCYGGESEEARIAMIEVQRYRQGVAAGLGHKLDVLITFERGGYIVEDLGHCELVE